MSFIIALLTFAIFPLCTALVFLVLIQLPKKEAGAGVAFGGTATDALFGAGSGTVLTKITKYAAAAFFIMTVLLSVLQNRDHLTSNNAFHQALTPRSASAPR